MPVREFTDSRGVEWRVWDVTPAHMHPATRAEDFMGNLQDGWLVFESEDEKRRLEAPYPADWVNFPIRKLEELWARAMPVVRRAAESTTGKRRAVLAFGLDFTPSLPWPTSRSLNCSTEIPRSRCPPCSRAAC